MKYALSLMAFFSINAMADLGDINCIAKQFEVGESALKNLIEKPLILETKTGSVVAYSVDIGDRFYRLSGDVVSGDFIITQTQGPDYNAGINATGSFNSVGRLQISQVDGAKVFKLE